MSNQNSMTTKWLPLPLSIKTNSPLIPACNIPILIFIKNIQHIFSWNWFIWFHEFCSSARIFFFKFSGSQAKKLVKWNESISRFFFDIFHLIKPIAFFYHQGSWIAILWNYQGFGGQKRWYYCHDRNQRRQAFLSPEKSWFKNCHNWTSRHICCRVT